MSRITAPEPAPTPTRAVGNTPGQARIVELRAFGGLGVEEPAEVLGISAAAVKRHWSFALARLQQRLRSGGHAPA